jgi:hypothetical protein
LFWSLVILALGTGVSFYGEGEKFFWDKAASAKFHKFSPENRLKLEKALLYRLFLKWLGKGWYYPFILTLITICIAESWPSKEDFDARSNLKSNN